MQVLSHLKIGYPQCPTRFFDFERLSSRGGDFVLMPCFFDFRLLDTDPAFARKKVVYLEFDEPNRFWVEDRLFNHREYDERLHRVFTLCPFSADWMNARSGGGRWAPMFFPFNERYTPEPRAKEFDVIYTGGVHSPSIVRMLKEISRFQYRCVSQTRHRYVTDFDNTYKQKLDLISRSRVSLVHNLLYLSPQHRKVLRQVPAYWENRAFDRVPREEPSFSRRLFGEPEVLAPHIKSRLFEAAFCRSLILCRRDPWNLVERYFEPGTEFIYFDDGKLRETLTNVLRNYGDYEPVIERAYERARQNYTTEAFFNRYLRDLS